MQQKVKSYTLVQAYEILKKYHLSDSLYLIGQVTSAFKVGIENSYEGVPKHVVAWLQRMKLDERMKLNIVTSSTKLARLLLLSGANDYKSKVLRLEDNSFAHALDVAGMLYEQEIDRDQLMKKKYLAIRILGRVSWQFNLQENPFANISRAYLLFVDIPKRIVSGYNMDDKLKQYYGMDCLSFLCTGLVLWTKCDGATGFDLSIDPPGLIRLVNEESQLQFLKISSGTPEQYRRALRGDDWKNPNKKFDMHFLDPFNRYPAIRVERSQIDGLDEYVVPQAKYFIDRASSGIFHLLAEKESEIGSQSGKLKFNPFRVYFGEIYREYVSLHLKQGRRIEFIDLDKDFQQPSKFKKPDFALIDGEVAVIFEVKTSLLSLSARSFFEEAMLQKEIERGSFNKAVDQLNEFRLRILGNEINDFRFEKVKRVICILVGYEDIYVLNSYLLPMLIEHYGAEVDSFQLGTIADIEQIGCLLAEEQSFGQIMETKLSEEEKSYFSIMQFLTEYVKSGNGLLADAGEQLFNDLTPGVI